MSDESWRLSKQVEAAKVLRQSYKEALGDDAEAIADTIEGETDLFEAMEAILDTMQDDLTMIGAIKEREKALKARRERLETRCELKRTMILSAMDIAELTKREFPVATVSRRPGPPKVKVVEQADIPSEFFEPQPPKLDKRKLDAAVLDREKALEEAQAIEDETARSAAIERVKREMPEIRGVAIGNRADQLSIRWA